VINVKDIFAISNAWWLSETKDFSWVLKLGHLLKVISIFIFRSLLVLIGLLIVASVFNSHFEESYSLSEVSIVEAAFYIVSIFLFRRYYRLCRNVDMKLKTIIYLPLRNMALFVLILLGLMLGYIIVFSVNKPTGAGYFIAVNENPLQLIYLLVFLLCILFSSPKKKVLSPVLMDDTKSEVSDAVLSE